MYKDNLDDFDRTITLVELRNEVDEEYKNMSDEEKYCRIRDNDPTFLRYCCSVMSSNNIEKGIINEYTYKFEKII
jgi:hypothetical protein